MNEPKEEARRMVERFFSTMLKNQDFKHVVYGDAEKHAKQCALIHCDEILNSFGLVSDGKKFYTSYNTIEYYESLKREIELL